MKRHPLDILSLLLGLVFLLVAVAYFAGDVSGSIPGIQVAMPLMLAGLGVAGVVGAIAAQQRSDDAIDTIGYAPAPAAAKLDDPYLPVSEPVEPGFAPQVTEPAPTADAFLAPEAGSTATGAAEPDAPAATSADTAVFPADATEAQDPEQRRT